MDDTSKAWFQMLWGLASMGCTVFIVGYAIGFLVGRVGRWQK